MTNTTYLLRRKRRRLSAVSGLALATTLLLAACAGDDGGDSDPGAGDDYPTRQIEYIIPYGPGGSTDTVGRAFTERLSKLLDQTVVPINREGGSGLVGVTAVANAEPDGYTIGFGSPGGMLIQPLVDPSLPTATPDQYTPIALMGTGPFSLAVQGESPWNSLEDLVADAKARPGEITVATTGGLAINTFVIAAWADAADIEVEIVPFDGSAEGQRELLGGHVDALVASSSGLVGVVEAGDVRALAVSGTETFSQMPDVPTFQSFGYEVPFEGAYITFAPKGLPEAVAQKLIDATTEILNSDDWKRWCADNGATPKSIIGDDLAAWITDQQEALRTYLPLVQGN